MDIPDNIDSIKNQIQQLEIRYARKPGTITLLAASKEQSILKIQEAIQHGQRIFGENYIQEALPKMKACHDQSIEWHFIGSIQTNKTKKIAEHFNWVQSVNCRKIAIRLNNQRPTSLPPLNICIEVNISNESSKSGLPIEETLSLANICSTLPKLKLRGLMAIPAFKQTLAEQREEYKKLRLLFDALNEKGFNLDTLSMGMSNDMEAAVAEGSTMLRIGTALFGNRT